MLDTVDVNFHGKRHTDFDLTRIIRAQEHGFDEPVTAYLCGVSIRSRAGIGVVFGHKRKDQYGRFGDGHLIRTSDVIKIEREGRFWVMTPKIPGTCSPLFSVKTGAPVFATFFGFQRGSTT